MAYNTNNPVPSSSPFDLFDNSENFDEGMNSTADTFRGRRGQNLYTWSFFHRMTANALAQINVTIGAAQAAVNSARDAGIEDISESVASVDAAEAAAKVQMEETAAALGDDLNNKYAATYAALQAMPQTRDAVVAVVDNDPDPTKNGWYRWDNTAKVWGFFINQPAMKSVVDGMIGTDSPKEGEFAVKDESGFSIASISKDGRRVILGPTSFSDEGLRSPAGDILLIPGNKVLLVDEDGFVLSDLVEQAAETEVHDLADMAERNAKNLASSSAVRGEINTQIQRPTSKYNHFPWYGQSLSTGFEGWPALSKVARDGNLMFGNSTRPASSGNAAFVPLGGAALKPLISVVQSVDGATILTDAEVAALAPGAGNEGEGPEVGAMNLARRMFLQQHALAADIQRLFVTTSCGRAGKTLEQLSKGASPNLYLRLLQAVQGVKAIADAEGATYCIPALVFMQGEYNYSDAYGGDPTKEGYKAKMLAQANIWKADLAQGVAAQPGEMAIITYQTGASYTRDENNLAIGMAQWELSEEQANWFMATPVYPYTDKGGHLDPNGYRWVGAQIGKVIHRVVTLGQGWKPLSPLRATLKKREMLVDFHVPCPPLAFDTPYVVLTPTNYIDKGFRVIDSTGVVPLVSVEIASETQVLITLGRDADTGLQLQYASKTASDGNGNLRDSDPTVSIDNYVYQAGTGQYAGANIPALVDKPYPLHNWCIAFSIAPEVI